MSRLRGRFEHPVDDAMAEYSASVGIDLRMAREDIAGSQAHARMLGEVGIISAAEAQQLIDGLDRIATELAAGEFVPTAEHEDIHMAVEARLEELVGEVAGRLHTARSRNDQVATDVRLWLRRQLVELDGALVELMRTLLERVRTDGRTLMPGYTHLQRGQPILLGHHLLGHLWPLWRDRQRLREAGRRLDGSPLGACALAGTSLPIDRHRTAELLGFTRVMDNALDAVAARDHEHEVAAACAIVMTHLSRMAAELVLWSSAEFRFVRLADAYTTGSSIMPQKRNPDAAELVRGQAARVHGNLLSLLSLVRGLPLAYNRDLQTSREPLFETVDTTRTSLEIMSGMWRTVTIDSERFADELAGDDCLATELADALVGKGEAFRTAHTKVGALVRSLEADGRRLGDVSEVDLSSHDIDLTAAEVGRLVDPATAVERRNSHGGTAWSEIVRQVEALAADLDPAVR